MTKTVPAEPEPESEDEVLTTSSDDELEELELEVKRFEKMVRPFVAVGARNAPSDPAGCPQMTKKIAVPGFVPVFTAPEAIGKGMREHSSIGTVMQRRILKKERQLYDPELEDDMDAILRGADKTSVELEAEQLLAQRPSKDTGGGAAESEALPPRSGPSGEPQTIISETDEDIEVSVGGQAYLVDVESGLVFHLVPSGEPPEVGTWNGATKQIEFD